MIFKFIVNLKENTRNATTANNVRPNGLVI